MVDGFLSGLHRSPYLGFSVDFAEHRPYNPGDDIRRIDWRLYARTDRHYIKLFEADTNANFSVLLDLSASMSYGSHSLTKLDYARYLGACLAYFSSKQRDRVGLVTFDHDIIDYVPPSMKHLDTILHTLDRAEAGRPGSLTEPLLKITEMLSRKGILVLISDFYEEPDRVLSAVGPLPYELEFPFEEASGFQDLETGEQIPVIPKKLRDDYLTMVQAHLAALQKRFSDNRVDYILLDTSKPLDEALFRYLLSREKLSKVR